MNKSSTEKIKQARKKIKMFLNKSFYFIFIPFILLGSCALSNLIQAETNVLTVIVTASSIIVAIITGFLLQSYNSTKDMRWEKLNRFADLQNRLRDYAWTFEWLTASITQKHSLNWRFPDSVEKLERDTDWIWENKNYAAVMFIRYLRDFAGNPNRIPDFELSHKIILEQQLEQMHHYITGAASLLAHQDYVKSILESFKRPLMSNLDMTTITDDPDVKTVAKRLTEENQNFGTIGFWETRIEECLEILDRMRMNGRFVYSFSTLETKQLALNLSFLSVFGILLPIIILMANDAMPPSLQSFLTIVSSVGFMLYFILGLCKTFLKIFSPQLSYS